MTRYQLPPFSGRGAKCTKCGTYSPMRIVYHRTALVEGFPCEHVPLGREHLCRVCPSCGYGRIEATADAVADPGALHSVNGG